MKERGVDWTKIKFGILALLILLFIGAYIYFTVKGYDVTEEIKNFAAEEKVPPLLFILLFVISAFFPLPLLTVWGSTIYKFWDILLYSVVGNMINAVLVFYVARWLGRGFVKKFEGKYKAAKELDVQFRKHAFRDTMLLRFFCIIPAEPVNISAGLSSVRFRDYFFGSLIGFIPASFAAILLVKSNLTGNDTLMFLSILFMALLIVIPLLYVSAIRKFSQGKWKWMKKFSVKWYSKAGKFFGLKK